MKISYEKLLHRWFKAHSLKPEFFKYICVNGSIVICVEAIDYTNMQQVDNEHYTPLKLEAVCVEEDRLSSLGSLGKLICCIKRSFFKFLFKFYNEDDTRNWHIWHNGGKINEKDYKQLLFELKHVLFEDENSAVGFMRKYGYLKHDYLKFDNERDLELKLAIVGV